MGVISGVSTLKDLTEKNLLEFLKKKISKTHEVGLPVEDLQQLANRHLKYDFNESDIEARCWGLFSSWFTLVEEQHLEERFQGKKAKLQGTLIMSVLKPRAFRGMVEAEVDAFHPDALTSPQKLFPIILKMAQNFESVRIALGKYSSDGSGDKSGGKPHSGRSANTVKGFSHGSRGSGVPVSSGSASASKDPRQGSSSSTPSNSSSFRGSKFSTPPAQGCLKCRGPHWVSQCPLVTDPAERQRLYDERAKTRSGKAYQGSPAPSSSVSEKDKSTRAGVFSSSVSAKSISADPQSAEPLRREENGLLCEFDGGIVYPYRLDSAADLTFVPPSVIAALERAGVELRVRTLSPAMKVALAADTAEEVCCQKVYRLTLKLTTAAGPVTLRNHEVYVLNRDMGEMLVGRETLHSLGLDLDLQLAHLAAKENATPPGLPWFVSSSSLSSPAANLEPPVGPMDAVDNDSEHVDVGFVDSDDLCASVEGMVQSALAAGFPVEYSPKLRKIIEESFEIWRVKLQGDPPAAVTPLVVRIKEGSVPRRCGTRRYSEEARKFMEEHVKLLEEFGFVKRNPHSAWAAPVLVVPKPAGRGYRFCVDLRGPNSCTTRVNWPMPVLDVVLQKLEGSTCYAVLDLYSGYWQFPLSEESQEYHSFRTDSGIYTPTRVIQGSCDGVAAFQSGMQEILGDLLYNGVFMVG